MKRSIFQSRVLKIVGKIEPGKVFTYQEVARRAGNLKAARAVGNILSKNYDKNIPCHRVVRSDGTPGGYNRGERKKQALLRREGARILLKSHKKHT